MLTVQEKDGMAKRSAAPDTFSRRSALMGKLKRSVSTDDDRKRVSDSTDRTAFSVTRLSFDPQTHRDFVSDVTARDAAAYDRSIETWEWEGGAESGRTSNVS